MRPGRRKLLIALAGAAGIAAAIFFLLPVPVEVDLAVAGRGPLRVTVDEDGKTRIKDRYVVSAPLAGRLLRIEMRPGDRVEAGKTLLAAVEPTDPSLLDERARAEADARLKAAEAAFQRAGADLERLREGHELARHALEMAKELIQSGNLSQDAYDAAEHGERMAARDLDGARFAVDIAGFELEQARAALLRIRPRAADGPESSWRLEILSPIDGQVLRVFQESATVAAPGLRLLELGDPADLEAEIDVLSTDAVRIHPGTKVIIEQWGGERHLRGRVRLVEPAAFTKVSALGVEEQRVWVIADFDDPFEERKTLGDAYRIEARIVIWEGEDVLKVPAGALFRQAEGWAVFVAAAGRARLRRVEIGWNNGLEAEALGGLAAGEQVVLHPSDRIREGVRIVPR
jgi:HlyD family secretion protein